MTDMKDFDIRLSVHLTLPDWISQLKVELNGISPSDEDKMRLAIMLAQRNVQEKTGGPFGAAIFNSATGAVISVGVNRVGPLNESTAHAEMMAFMLAQQRMNSFRLDATQHQIDAGCHPASICPGNERPALCDVLRSLPMGRH